MSERQSTSGAPDVIVRRHRRRLFLGGLGFALVFLVAATALAHGFDLVITNAGAEQLSADGYPTYQVACSACDPGFPLPVPDWRALSIWALAMVAAGVGWVARRR